MTPPHAILFARIVMIVMPSCCGSFSTSPSMSTTYDTPFHRIRGTLFPFYVFFIPLYLFYDVDFSGCLALLVSLPGLCFIIHVYKYSVVALHLGFILSIGGFLFYLFTSCCGGFTGFLTSFLRSLFCLWMVIHDGNVTTSYPPLLLLLSP